MDNDIFHLFATRICCNLHVMYIADPLHNLFVFQLEDAQRQLETSNKEQEALIDIFSEERGRRDLEEENLRGKLKVSARDRASISLY